MNIPKGQLVRLIWNCTSEADYKHQAEFIGERFVDKGYEKSFFQHKIEEIRNIERQKKNKEKEESKYTEIPLIFYYNLQFEKLESIVRKHWKILLADRYLNQVLPPFPRFVYRRAPTLHDLLAENGLDPPSKKVFTFFEGKGFYPCKNCYASRHITFRKKNKDEFSANVTGQK